MDEWVKEQLARGFADFEGTTLTGAIPVKTEFLHQLIARFLAQGGQAPSPAADLRPLARFVRSATVEAEPGVIILRFEIGV
jgi:hypothetical protein